MCIRYFKILEVKLRQGLSFNQLSSYIFSKTYLCSFWYMYILLWFIVKIHFSPTHFLPFPFLYPPFFLFFFSYTVIDLLSKCLEWHMKKKKNVEELLSLLVMFESRMCWFAVIRAFIILVMFRLRRAFSVDFSDRSMEV